MRMVLVGSNLYVSIPHVDGVVLTSVFPAGDALAYAFDGRPFVNVELENSGYFAQVILTPDEFLAGLCQRSDKELML